MFSSVNDSHYTVTTNGACMCVSQLFIPYNSWIVHDTAMLLSTSCICLLEGRGTSYSE